MEERRLHVDNQIFGMLDEQLGAAMWHAHPYRWPIIGWMGDIEAITREQCLEFFRTYYAPNNATLYVVGDFEPDQALSLIESHYADLPAGPPLPPVPTYEPEQRGERRAGVSFPAQSSALAIGYHAPAVGDALTPALDILQYALSAGEGAILTRQLVYEQELAVGAVADFGWRIDPGAFVIFAELGPRGSPAKAEAAIGKVIARVVEKGLTAAEMERAKNLLRARQLSELATHQGRAHAFGDAEILLGDWRAAWTMLDRYQKVTAAEVRKAARQVFDPQRRSVITLVPTAAS
jgi:predicted Zn-dependent peptidase